MRGAAFELFALKGGAALGASAVVMSLNKKACDALHEPKALEIVSLGHGSALSSTPRIVVPAERSASRDRKKVDV
jgi:hypothetical protein